MTKVENGPDNNSGIGARILNSSLADKARDIPPETAKRILRQVVLGQKYPLAEPLVVTLAGINARFWVRDYSDSYRLGGPDFERRFGEELIQTIKDRGGFFIDVGSAQGKYSVIAAETGSYVYAIDPDPVSQERLRANILLNPGVENIITQMEIALANKPGVMTLHVDRTGTHASSLRRTRGLNNKVDIEVTTMDALVFAGTIPHPNVVKIDVEGAEGLVVLGMQGILSSDQRPSDIFIELYGEFLPLFGTTEKEVIEGIVNNRYELVSCLTRRNESLCHFRAY